MNRALLLLKEVSHLDADVKRTVISDKLKDSPAWAQALLYYFFKDNYADLQDQLYDIRNDSESRVEIFRFLIENKLIENILFIMNNFSMDNNQERQYIVELIQNKTIAFEHLPILFTVRNDAYDNFSFFKESLGIEEIECACYLQDGSLQGVEVLNVPPIYTDFLKFFIFFYIRDRILQSIPSLVGDEKIKILLKIESGGLTNLVKIINRIQISKNHMRIFENDFLRSKIDNIKFDTKKYIEQINQELYFEKVISNIKEFHDYMKVTKYPGIYGQEFGDKIKCLRNFNSHHTVTQEDEKNFIVNFAKNLNEIDSLVQDIFNDVVRTLDLMDCLCSVDFSVFKRMLVKNLFSILYETNNMEFISEILKMTDAMNDEKVLQIITDYEERKKEIENDKGLSGKPKKNAIRSNLEEHDFSCYIVLDLVGELIKINLVGFKGYSNVYVIRFKK